MSIFRFSLRWLLAFVAFIGVGIASLRYASVLISGGLAIVWLLFLTVTVLGVVYGRERRRAFWFGCCIFGWAFAAHAYLSQVTDAALDRAIQSIYERVSWTDDVDFATGKAHQARGTSVTHNFSGFSVELPPRDPFEAALRVLIGIAASISAGVIAQWFHAAQKRIAGREEHME